MTKNVIITPASGLVGFYDLSGNIKANIELDNNNNLTITGNVKIGDLGADILVGDGVSPVNVVFEQGGSIFGLAGKTLTLGQANSFVTVGTSLSVTGNITGGNLITAGAVTGNGRALTSLNATNINTGTVPAARLSGTYTITVSGAATTAGTVTTAAQPNITSVGTMAAATITTLSTAGITKTGTNGVGNIGAAASTFNTVFAKATSAQYADVAEQYQADADYPPGTVLVLGGAQEVTASTHSHDTAVAGVVSQRPSYLMNAGLQTANSVPVALLGRVPCQVVGTITRGQLLVTSSTPGTATALDHTKYVPGCVIGKALEDYNSNVAGIIEIAVGIK